MTNISTSSTTASVSEREIDNVERSLIDASMRGAVLFLFGTSILWLLASLLLGAVSVMKIIWPEFMTDCSVLTYGRIWPAYYNALIYGWGLQVGLGVLLWISGRLCRVGLKRPGWIVIGSIIWNLGVAAGTIAILLGYSTGWFLLEYPPFAASIMFAGWAVIAGWIVSMFAGRRPGHVYISLWYILGAVLWFPWLTIASRGLLGSSRIHGVMLNISAAWYSHSLLYVILPAIGIAAIYYLIPKVVGKPIHSYNLAKLGFWSFAILAGWGGMIALIGGPIPAWMITFSIASMMMMLVPIATVTVNYGMTMKSDLSMVYHSPTVRFVFFGAIAYTVAGLFAVLFSFRSVARYVQYSDAAVGQWHLLALAFYSMVMFGAIYYITPRLVGCEWFSPAMIRLHFWGAGYGIGLAIFLFMVGGAFTGGAWDATDLNNTQVIEAAQPFLFSRLLPWFLILPANAVFALHFLMMALRLGRPAGQPTLFTPSEHH